MMKKIAVAAVLLLGAMPLAYAQDTDRRGTGHEMQNGRADDHAGRREFDRDRDEHRTTGEFRGDRDRGDRDFDRDRGDRDRGRGDIDRR